MSTHLSDLRFTATITLKNLRIADVESLVPSVDVSVDVTHANGEAYNLVGEVSNVRVQLPEDKQS